MRMPLIILFPALSLVSMVYSFFFSLAFLAFLGRLLQNKTSIFGKVLR